MRDPGCAGARGVAAATVIVAIRLEAQAVRRALPHARIVVAGVGLSRLRGPVPGPVALSCGLAGALRPDLRTGTVLVPDRVLRPGGGWLTCDPDLVDALVAAARRLALPLERGPLVTSPTIVRGPARDRWARQGCVAADMETGLLAAPRVAAVRVVLDTPARELSDVWLRPLRALARPSAWPEALWLAREAPRCARRAAAVLAAALHPDAPLPDPGAAPASDPPIAPSDGSGAA